MKRISFLLIAAFVLIFSACGPQPGNGTPDYTIAYDTIAGVDPNLLSLDIYNDGIAGPAPVVIWIHGGVWQVGDKANGMEFKETMCKKRDYLLVSINYRLSTSGSGVMHPAHVQDVAHGIAWVYNNISLYGGDPTKIAVMGHSAGGHLAALVCTDETYLQTYGLDLSIIQGCGTFDTEGYNIPYSMANGNDENQYYLDAFGSNQADWANASPTLHVAAGKNIPNDFLFVKRGDNTRQHICVEFSDALRGIGVNTNIIDGSWLTHEEVNTHIGAPNDDIMTVPVLAFLTTVFN